MSFSKHLWIKYSNILLLLGALIIFVALNTADLSLYMNLLLVIVLFLLLFCVKLYCTHTRNRR